MFPRLIYPYRQVLAAFILCADRLVSRMEDADPKSSQLFTPDNIGAHENLIWHINRPFRFSSFSYEIAPIPKAWAAMTGILPPASEGELLFLCHFRCVLTLNWYLLKDMLSDIRRVAILLLSSNPRCSGTTWWHLLIDQVWKEAS